MNQVKAHSVLASSRIVHAQRGLTQQQKESRETAEKEEVKILWDDALQAPRSVRGKDLENKKFTGKRGSVLRNDPVALLESVSSLFGMTDPKAEFIARKTSSDQLGHRHVRMGQHYKGLRVVGGELIVHFDAKGSAYEVNGEYIKDIRVSPTAKLKEEDALRLAKADLEARGNPPQTVVKVPELVVYARMNLEPRLAYELALKFPGTGIKLPGYWLYWVDATDGTIINAYNDIKQLTPNAVGTATPITGQIMTRETRVTGDDGSRTVGGWTDASGMFFLHNPTNHWQLFNTGGGGFYTDALSYAYRPTTNWANSDPAEMSIAANVNTVQLYFRQIMGRNSWDNKGTMIPVNVHYGVNYVNGFWDGSTISIGDGDNVTATCLGTLDIMGHELSHGVTQATANLVYQNESGALNESFSDIFGTCIEFFGQPDGSSLYPQASPGMADWLCGEDAWLRSTALRDLRDPKNVTTVGAGNQQPSRYQGDFWGYGADDNGGVHQNSGPHNFFFYLLSQGGIGTNELYTYNFTGIGINNAEQLAYRVLSAYCTENTDYKAIRILWLNAAMDMNPDWIGPVIQAWGAVMGPTAPLKIQTESPLPNGRVGSPYQVSFGASGGMFPVYSWERISGQLPANFTFSTNGILSGFCVEPSTNTFTVVVSCIDHQKTTNTFELTILPAYTAPYSEGFNGAMEGELTGWHQECVSNAISWRMRIGSPSTRPPSAFEGEKNAYLGVFNDNGTASFPPHVTRLISPMIQFGPYAREVRVSFAYYLEDWPPLDPDQLKVYYKTAWSDSWIGPIATYTANTVGWTQQSITLPEPASVAGAGKGVYFAFEGSALGGHGISLDAIVIDDPVPPLHISTPTPLPIALCGTNYTLSSPLVILESVGGFTNALGLTNYQYAVVNGTSLPSGFILTPEGVITGRWNSVVAMTNFDVEVTDGFAKATNTLSFAVEYPRASVLAESFYGDNVLSSGWTMEYVANTVDWTIGRPGGKDGWSPPATAQSDLQYAVFFGTPGVGTVMCTKLVSPVFDLTQMPNNTRLVFWHFMQEWAGQDELRVYYRNVQEGPWTKLATYTSNVTSWTQRIIPLPFPTRYYQIAFEGLAKSGYGVCVDTVSITDDGGAPVMLTRGVLPSGFDNFSYQTSLEAVGGSTPYRWTVVSNGLPRGLVLDSVTGIISGIPVGSTQTVFRVAVTGADNQVSANTFSLKILPPGIVPYFESFATNALPANWEQVTASGSQAAWQVSQGTYSFYESFPSNLKSPMFAYSNSLPNNVCLWAFPKDDGTANIASLITKPFDLGGCTNTTLSFQLCMKEYGSYQDILSVYYRSRETDAWTLLAVYETNTTVWTLKTLQLPNPSATYRLKFEGYALGGWGICIDDVDVRGEKAGSPLAIITPTRLPEGTNHVAYPPVTLVATNGTLLPYTWRIVKSDILPTGLTLDANTGTISGTPAEYGFFTFGVTVQDANNVATTSNFNLRVYSGSMTPFEEWQSTYFSTLGYLGDDVDQSGDGIPNLIKYGMGLNPTNKNLGIYILGGLTNLAGSLNVADGRYLYLGYRRSLTATDVNFFVKGTTNLANGAIGWLTNNIVEQTPWIVGETDVWSWVYSVHTTPVTNAPQRFLRLEVSTNLTTNIY
ncbi:MAG: M4 family metallopeptidase [bacterium]